MSQTPPPSEDRQPGLLRSLLIRFLRRVITFLDRWLVSLEAPEAAEPLPLWQNPLLWLGAIAAVGVAVVVVPQLTSEPAEVALTPTPAPVSETPSAPVQPEQPLVETPSQTLPSEDLNQEPEPAETPQPPMAEAPESPPEPVVEPQPVQLTPEQQLVAAVRSQVREVARPYETCHRSGINLKQQEDCTEENRFVTRISANFESDLLRVEITPQWYALDSPKRTELANGLWGKAQRLDFSHVEIVDDQGVLVARSPVVGNDVIILRRSH